MPLSPGALAPLGAQIGINWSGCYGDASQVPAVVGLSLPRRPSAPSSRWGSPGPASRSGKTAATTTTTCPAVRPQPPRHPRRTRRRPPRPPDDDDGQVSADRVDSEPGRGHRAAPRRHRHPHHAPLPPMSRTPMSTGAGGGTGRWRSAPTGGQSGPLALSSGRGRWVVAATVLGSGIAMLDATVVGIALPSIGRDFHGGVGTLQWVVTGYTLTLAAFLLLGGSLGDRYGRRRIFSIGVAWFAVASALCGIAPTARRPHRRPGGAGDRRSAAGAGQPGHPADLLPLRRPRPCHRRLVGVERRGQRRRPARRGLPARRRLVALGLLHQPARGRGRPRDHGRATCPSRATPPPPAGSTPSGPRWP